MVLTSWPISACLFGSFLSRYKFVFGETSVLFIYGSKVSGNISEPWPVVPTG